MVRPRPDAACEQRRVSGLYQRMRHAGHKSLQLAVRFDMNPLSLKPLSLKTTQGDPVSYTLLSLPVYLAERIYQFLEQAFSLTSQ